MLNDPLNIISLTGDGVQTVFDVPFKIWDVAELEVSILTASGASTVVSDWTATISPGGLGGTVTYPTSGDPLPSGDKIVVRRVVPIQQKVDLVHANRVLPDVVENALDRLTAMVAQNAEEVDRAVKGAPGQTATDYLNELDADRAAAELAAQNAQAAQTAAEQAQTAAETAAGTAAADAAAGVLTEVSQYATSAQTSATNAAQSAAEAEAAAGTVVSRYADFTVGAGGQQVFHIPFAVFADIANAKMVTDGLENFGAFPCDVNGDPVATGATAYMNAGGVLPEGTEVRVWTSDPAALGDITGLADAAAASAQSAADDAAAVAATKTEIDDFRNDLLVEPQQKTGTVSAGTNVINLGTTGFRASGVRLYLGGSKQRYGSDYTVNADTGVITLTSAAAFETTWIADIDSYVVGTTGGGGGTVAWADVTGKPATFPPSVHTHTIPDVTGLQTALDTQSAAIATKVDQSVYDNEIASLAAAISDRALQTDLVSGLAAKENTLSPSQKLRINVSVSAPTAGDAANYDMWFEVS